MLKQGISVIIPTYNRSTLLNKTLRSLVDQDLDKCLYEVIIVDDGSSDDTFTVVETFNSLLNVKYFYQEDDGFRVAKARNTGIKNASFKNALFFDCGMIAESTLLSKHLSRHSLADDLVLIGMAYGFEEFTTTNFDMISRVIDNNCVDDAIKLLAGINGASDCRDEFLKSHGYSVSNINIPWILLWTCHVSCPVPLLNKVGCFDEYFTSWGGEDVEVGIRLCNASANFQIIDEARAIHYPHSQDSVSRKKSSLNNCQYIHNKHNCYSSQLLCEGFEWKEIIEINRINDSWGMTFPYRKEAS